jgi:hypothetical protein
MPAPEKAQPLAAHTMIFTSSAGSASFASPQARAGAWPAGTQASHTAVIASKSAMSVSVYFSLTEIGVQFSSFQASTPPLSKP